MWRDLSCFEFNTVNLLPNSLPANIYQELSSATVPHPLHAILWHDNVLFSKLCILVFWNIHKVTVKKISSLWLMYTKDTFSPGCPTFFDETPLILERPVRFVTQPTSACSLDRHAVEIWLHGRQREVLSGAQRTSSLTPTYSFMLTRLPFSASFLRFLPTHLHTGQWWGTSRHKIYHLMKWNVETQVLEGPGFPKHGVVTDIL